MNTIPAYPLQWPAGWPRTDRTQAKHGKFGKRRDRFASAWRPLEDLTIAEAVSRVRDQLTKMGISDDDVVISTDLLLRLDGLPRSGQAEPRDPGAAVYWRDRNGETRCMAIDRYKRVADNIAAVAATLDAMRAIERHGGAEILDRAFTGFAALAAPSAPSWRDVLDPSDPEGSYRRLRAQHHPDKGGAPDAFQCVQEAWDAYRKEAGK